MLPRSCWVQVVGTVYTKNVSTTNLTQCKCKVKSVPCKLVRRRNTPEVDVLKASDHRETRAQRGDGAGMGTLYVMMS